MILTHFEAMMAALAALFSVLAIVAGGMRWVYKQGVSSTRLVHAIDSNTQATAALSGAFGKFSDKTDGTLTDHERRITRVEDRVDSLAQEADRRRHPLAAASERLGS